MGERPGHDIPVTIVTNVWAAGCLPETLRRQIVAVDTHLRLDDRMTAETRRNLTDYLDQLRSVLDAVVKARKKATHD